VHDVPHFDGAAERIEHHHSGVTEPSTPIIAIADERRVLKNIALVALDVEIVAFVSYGAAILIADEDAFLARRKVAYSVESVGPEDRLTGCSAAARRGVGVGDGKFPDPAEARNDLIFEDELVPLWMRARPEVQGRGHAGAHKIVFPFEVLRARGMFAISARGLERFDGVPGDPIDVEVPVGAARPLLLKRVKERRAPVVAILLMAKVAHPVEGALLVATDMLRELVERHRRLVPQAVDSLEPDEVRVFAGNMLPSRDRNVSQAAP
jgi:hypothetical protein